MTLDISERGRLTCVEQTGPGNQVLERAREAIQEDPRFLPDGCWLHTLGVRDAGGAGGLGRKTRS